MAVARRKLSVLGCMAAAAFNAMLWYGVYRVLVWAGIMASFGF